MAEKVSVIIPLHNAGQFLEQTISSVLEQTFTDWHLYIVDDCSTDESVQTATNFSARYPNAISYVRLKEPAGKPSVGKNYAINLSQGAYIAFLDHDDWWLKDHLLGLVSRLDTDNSLSITGSNAYFYDNDKRKVLGTYRPINENLSAEEARLFTLRQPTYLTSSCMLIRRTLIEQTGLLDESLAMSDDHEIEIRAVALKGYQLESRGKPTIFRRWLKSSLSNGVNSLPNIVADVEKIYQKYSKNDNLSVEEKKLLFDWHLMYQIRWGNYLLVERRYQEAKKLFHQLISSKPSRKLKIISGLARFSPSLARIIVTAKKRWSFDHPDLYPLSEKIKISP